MSRAKPKHVTVTQSQGHFNVMLHNGHPSRTDVTNITYFGHIMNFFSPKK